MPLAQAPPLVCAVGLAEGVTADQADEIFMPLAPGLLVAVGPPDGARAIPDHEVDLYNQRQARAAHLPLT